MRGPSAAGLLLYGRGFKADGSPAVVKQNSGRPSCYSVEAWHAFNKLQREAIEATLAKKRNQVRSVKAAVGDRLQVSCCDMARNCSTILKVCESKRSAAISRYVSRQQEFLESHRDFFDQQYHSNQCSPMEICRPDPGQAQLLDSRMRAAAT